MEEIVTMKVKAENAKLEFAGAMLDNETGEPMEYCHLIKNLKYKQTWSHSYKNELGKLAQGMPDQVEGTTTMSCQQK